MKNIYRKIGMSVLLITVLLSIMGCEMVESYKEFNIKNITDYLEEDYFNSDNFGFAKVENVVFIPEIKEIHHGEYIIYISAYSETGEEKIKIKNIIMSDSESVLLNHELNKNIVFKENANAVFEGWVDGGTFTEDDIEIKDGKEFDCIVQVEVLKDDTTVRDNISFEIYVKGYKSFRTPT